MAVHAGTTTAPKGLLARAIGILTSPRATYAEVAGNPRWLGALLAVIIVGAAAVGTFLSTEVGHEALLDQQITTLESFGMHPTEAQLTQMQDPLKFVPYVGVGGQVVTLIILGLVVAGIALAVFNAFLGGDATFKQVFSVVTHSGFVLSLQPIIVLPLDYARSSMSSPTNLGVFLPFLDEDTFVARLLGSIDLFVIWWMVSLAIGLGVLYRRRTGPIATTLLAIYVAIGLIVAGAKSALSGA